jgi:hypothetical protein
LLGTGTGGNDASDEWDAMRQKAGEGEVKAAGDGEGISAREGNFMDEEKGTKRPHDSKHFLLYF